jgi:hypothetical protein
LIYQKVREDVVLIFYIDHFVFCLYLIWTKPMCTISNPDRTRVCFLGCTGICFLEVFLAVHQTILRCEVFMWRHWCYINTFTVWRIAPYWNSIHAPSRHYFPQTILPTLNVKLSLIGWFESTSANFVYQSQE